MLVSRAGVCSGLVAVALRSPPAAPGRSPWSVFGKGPPVHHARRYTVKNQTNCCKLFNAMDFVGQTAVGGTTTVICIKAFACSRSVSSWCSHTGATAALANCDGDGTQDIVCTDTAGNRGVLSSSRNCDTAQANTGWPAAPMSLCPAAFTPPPSPSIIINTG